jgi:hypothetical protein
MMASLPLREDGGNDPPCGGRFGSIGLRPEAETMDVSVIAAEELQEWCRQALERAVNRIGNKGAGPEAIAEELEAAAADNDALRHCVMIPFVDGGVASGLQALKEGCLHAAVAYVLSIAEGTIPPPAIHVRKR